MEMDGANHAVPAINEHASEEPRTSGSGSVESGKREGDKDNPCFARCFPSTAGRALLLCSLCFRGGDDGMQVRSLISYSLDCDDKIAIL